MWTCGKEFRTWVAMLQRCYDERHATFKHYGERGISVCQRWRQSYENFFEDLGLAPSPDHSLDRIDVNGDYEASNCRWATREVQCNNKRNNRLHEYLGRTQTATQWAREFGISTHLVHARLKHGWTIERALNCPFDTRPLMLTHNGKTQSVGEWSKEIGVPTATIHTRIRTLGYSVEQALEKPPRRLLTAHGKTQSVTEWAKEIGLSTAAIKKRLSNGLTDEEAVQPDMRFKKN